MVVVTPNFLVDRTICTKLKCGKKTKKTVEGHRILSLQLKEKFEIQILISEISSFSVIFLTQNDFTHAPWNFILDTLKIG